MGTGKRGADAPFDAGQRPDRRIARAAVLADDQRQFEMDFDAKTELSVETAGADDMSLVENALSDLEQLEAEMSELTDSL